MSMKPVVAGEVVRHILMGFGEDLTGGAGFFTRRAIRKSSVMFAPGALFEDGDEFLGLWVMGKQITWTGSTKKFYLSTILDSFIGIFSNASILSSNGKGMFGLETGMGGGLDALTGLPEMDLREKNMGYGSKFDKAIWKVFREAAVANGQGFTAHMGGFRIGGSISVRVEGDALVGDISLYDRSEFIHVLGQCEEPRYNPKATKAATLSGSRKKSFSLVRADFDDTSS